MSFKANLTGNLAYQSQMKGESEKAIQLYESALSDGMNKPNLIDAYGILLMKEGDFEKAIQVFTKALKVEHNPGQRYLMRVHRAIAYLKKGDIKTAKVALEDINQKEELQSVYETLGYLYIITDDEKARTFNEKAINLYPENTIILDNIGQFYISKGHPEIAKEFLEEAYEIDENKVDVNYHLAQVAQSEGKTSKALEYLNKAQECTITALNDTTPQDIDTLLEELKGY